MKTLSLLNLILLLGACSTGINPAQFVGEDKTYDDFTLCHGYGCSKMMDIGISDKSWKAILKGFRLAPKSAAIERERIAQAAAKFESYVQQVSGLPQDKAEARHLPEDAGQMDCIDETVNLSQFLEFLDRAKVLKFHVASRPIHRGYFIDGKWPHNTATITEIGNGQVYAVDGFYRPAGQPPYIIEKKIWMANWQPNQLD